MTVQPGEEKAERGSINFYIYLMIRCQMNGAKLFSVACGNRRRGSGHKLEHRMFHTNTRKVSFTVRVTEHWNRLPRSVVESLFLDILKTPLDSFPCNLSSGTCFSRGLDKMILRGHFQPPTIL